MSFQPGIRRVVQDMPPPGGFPSIDIARTARARGATGFQIWAVSSLAIAFGFYQVGRTNRMMSGEKLEARKARYAMAPVIQAESDRWYMARENEMMKQEAEIMKDVHGWKVGESTYLTNRWVPRHVAPMEKNSKK